VCKHKHRTRACKTISLFVTINLKAISAERMEFENAETRIRKYENTPQWVVPAHAPVQIAKIRRDDAYLPTTTNSIHHHVHHVFCVCGDKSHHTRNESESLQQLVPKHTLLHPRGSSLLCSSTPTMLRRLFFQTASTGCFRSRIFADGKHLGTISELVNVARQLCKCVLCQ